MPDQDLPVESRPSLPAPSGGWVLSLDRGLIQSLLLGIIAGLMILAALDAARLIAVPTVLALLCAIALAPWVRWLERSGAPASLCVALVVGSILIGAASTVYFLAPSAEAWNSRAPQILREVERRAREIASGVSHTLERGPEVASSDRAGRHVATAPGDVPEPKPGEEVVDKLVEGGQRLLADWAIGAPGLAAGFAFWAMLTFFLLRDRVMLARWGMSLIPWASTRRAVGRALRDVRTNVARYLLAISAINLGLGLCTAAAFYLLGVENAPLWGVAAALLNFMPFIGIAILAAVTLGVGIVSFEDPLIAFSPFAVVVMLNVVESQMVTPMVVGSRIRIASIAVFVAIAFGAWLWGAAGALVATPALIVAVAFVRRINIASRRSRPSRQNERGQKGREWQ